MAAFRVQLLLLLLLLLWTASGGAAPPGCGSQVDSLYFNLCSLSSVWGVVVEAFAAAGVISSVVLLIVLLFSLPFITDKKRWSSVGLQLGFLVSVLGLFSLTFAFIVGKDFSTCTSRRFLFGVLFAGCFSCLLMQSVRLNVLVRSSSGPRGWVLGLGALGLWLVEVVINSEWLIITMVRYPVNTTDGPTGVPGPVPCNFANQDFAMALIYVMNLLLAVTLASLATMGGKHKIWRRDGAFILVTSLLSVGIWVAWITMYVHGNARTGGPAWDDPTLAIALVSNAWVLLLLHAIPELCAIADEGEGEAGYGEELYPSRGVGYETILKEQSSHNIFMENKAFSLDEPNSGHKPVSPYSGYNGQLRSSVYQPTELALINKGLTNVTDLSYDIPRASVTPQVTPQATPQAQSGRSSPSLLQANSGNGLHRKPNW
ncbi:G-protein coupled receptor family C group 5 member C [Denticeps clupeoides]|nr:G-protein coupled receptor family C group 5 member C [Denticeps clupeoides]